MSIIKEPEDQRAAAALARAALDEGWTEDTLDAERLLEQGYKLGYDRAAKIALDAQQAQAARERCELALDDLEKGVQEKRCSLGFALAAAARAGAQYIQALPESDRSETNLAFPGGTVSTAGMQEKPSKPTTLTGATPLDELILEVNAAILQYENTGDHKHLGGPYPGDCIACKLAAALIPSPRDAQNPEDCIT